MIRRALAAAALAGTLAAAPAAAQAVDSVPLVRFAGACSSGLPGGGPTCPFERRLVVDLQRLGPGAPAELLPVVSMGAASANVFALSLDAATARDSMYYAVVHVERGAAGDYRLRTYLAGPRAPAQACASSATGRSGDLTFGAHLATAVAQLVRCAQETRPAGDQ